MNRDELMALARQAGHIPDRFISASTLERFAELVRADEREACAEYVEGMNVQHPKHIAAAIRARKDKQ